MAITSTRTTTFNFTGGSQDMAFPVAAAANANSPQQDELKTLAAGANTITVPTSGTIPTAVTIIPPASNVVSLTFKGVSGDTGVRLHNTDPSSIALDPSVTTFVLTAGNTITGVRLIWS